MAYHNLNHVLLLALVLVLVPTASLAQELGADIGLSIEIQGSLNNTGIGPIANTNVTVVCGNMDIASGITNSEGRYNISAQDRLEVGVLAQAGECSLRAQLMGNQVPRNVSVQVERTRFIIWLAPSIV